MASDAASGILASAVATGPQLVGSPGVTGSIGLVITGTPEGDVKVRMRMVDGRPVEAETAGGGADPELTLTVTCGDAAAIARGDMAPSVAFMRGRLKTAGDNGLLLRLLAATARPGFGPWLRGLAPVDHGR